jgi:phosphoserine phosphatase
MSDDMETRIRERIEALTKQREQAVAAVNQQVAALSNAIKERERIVSEHNRQVVALSGAIKELEALVAEQDGDKQEPDKEA